VAANESYGLLACAIVRQAVKDYREAQARLCFSQNDCIAKNTIEEIKDFFRSDWYQTLHEISPETIPQNMLKVLEVRKI